MPGPHCREQFWQMADFSGKRHQRLDKIIDPRGIWHLDPICRVCSTSQECMSYDRNWILAPVCALLLATVAAPNGRALSLNNFTRGVISRDGICRFEVPGDWEPIGGLNRRATIQVGNPQNDEFMIAFSADRSAFPASPQSSLLKAVKELDRNSPKTRILSRKRFVSRGHEFRVETFRTEVKGRPVLYYVAIIRSPTHLVQVVVWTKPAKQRAFDRKVPEILKTFLELKRE
jgi:hypothetical protein